ncbi:MAG: hypothetical protein ACLP1X_18850 [Polyangiaceae bacterium]|jgi:hypothetical protein
MAGDEILTLALVLAFALLVTAHVALVAGLAGYVPRWRALVALIAAPLAPYWGFKVRMHGRAVLWVASAAAYGVLRLLAARFA